MKKVKNIFNLILIDASGSMRGKEEEVQGGINQIFQELKMEDKEDDSISNRISVIDFSSHGDFQILFDNVKASDLEQLKDGEYQPRSMTALYDAIGKSFEKVPSKQDGVLVTIFTDGLENDSKEFNASNIKALIEKKEKEGWTVTYMGTTQQAMLEAERMGISAGKRFRYANSKDGTKRSMNAMSSSRRKHMDWVKDGNVMAMDDAFDDFEDGSPKSDKT